MPTKKKQLKKDWLKQVENLHLLDEQYKTLAENSEDMIIRFDRSYNIVYANHYTEKIFDLPRILFVSRCIRDLDQPAEQLEFWTRNLERVFSLGFSINENLVLIINNQKIYYNVKFVPEKKETGEITHVFASARDITELKTKEKALYESQWHLKQAQRIAKIGSWEWHLRYNTLTLSDELYQIVGLTPSKNPQSLAEIRNYISKDFYQLLISFHESPPTEFTSFELEITVRRTDNQIRHCVIRGESITGSDGRLKKLHGTLQDITERKMMERELKSAKLKAEESDKLKSAFLANMSHEIRTPLNGILGFSELLKHKNLSAEKRHFYIDIICSNGKQLLNIISDIIDISRIESGQITIDKSNFCPTNLFNELMLFLKTDLKSKGKSKIETELRINNKYQDISIISDEIHLKQIMINLISNAVKFTTSGRICIGFEIKGKNIEFFVSDTGIGIKPEYHNVIFERFRQANESASREHGGTGLGLAICKNLVKLMNGAIWVRSEEEKGSEFRFSLPLITAEKQEPYNEKAEDIFSYSWPGKKILVVEDDHASYELLKETLSDTYAILYNADDGEKALLMHQTIKPDIILMDIRLPKLSGIEVIQSIRKTDNYVSIIAITANAFVEDKINCMSAGADDYISKPVNHLELLSKLNIHLAKAKESNTTIKAMEG